MLDGVALNAWNTQLRKEYLDQNGFESEEDLSNVEYRSMLDYVDSHKGMKKPLKLCLVVKCNICKPTSKVGV